MIPTLFECSSYRQPLKPRHPPDEIGVLLEIDTPLYQTLLQSLQAGEALIGRCFPQQRHHRLRQEELRDLGRQVR